jgi:hypothetical protein
MACPIQNKREISCQINTLERIRRAEILLHKVPRERKQQNCLENGWIMQFRHVSYADFTSAIFSIPINETHPQTKNVLQCQTPKKL